MANTSNYMNINNIDQNLAKILRSTIDQSTDYQNQKFLDYIQKADRYYRLLPRGDEIENRSKYISSDVKEVVDSFMPEFSRILFSSISPVEYIPLSPGDEDYAKSATIFINYLFNEADGPYKLLELAHLGLLYRIAAIYVGIKKGKSSIVKSFKGLTDIEYQALKFDSTVKIIEEISYPDPIALEQAQKLIEYTDQNLMLQIPQIYDVKIMQIIPDNSFVLKTIPPEDLIFDWSSQSLEDQRYYGFKSYLTDQGVIELGYDPDDLTPTLIPINQNTIKSTRNKTPNTTNNQKFYVYYELYLDYDIDNDGILEPLKICWFNNDFNYLKIEVDSYRPLVYWQPMPLPATLIGTSPAENVLDIQDLKTVIMRNTLDNFYRASNIRPIVTPGVNMQDLLNTKPGSPIRVESLDSITWLKNEPLTQSSFELLNKLDDLREWRTGITKISNGLDPDAFNQTYRGTKLQLNAGQQRKEIIIKRFIDNTLKKIFEKILYLVVTNYNQEIRLFINNQWLNFTPSSWSTNLKISTKTGLGTADKTEEINIINSLLALDREIIQLQGTADGPILNLQNIYNKLKKLIDLVGLGDVAPYYQDPATYVPPPAQPTTEDQMMQLEIAKLQLAKQAIEQDYQLKLERVRLEETKKQQDLQTKITELQLELQKLKQDYDIKTQQLELEKNKIILQEMKDENRSI